MKFIDRQIKRFLIAGCVLAFSVALIYDGNERHEQSIAMQKVATNYAQLTQAHYAMASDLKPFVVASKSKAR